MVYSKIFTKTRAILREGTERRAGQRLVRSVRWGRNLRCFWLGFVMVKSFFSVDVPWGQTQPSGALCKPHQPSLCDKWHHSTHIHTSEAEAQLLTGCLQPRPFAPSLVAAGFTPCLCPSPARANCGLCIILVSGCGRSFSLLLSCDLRGHWRWQTRQPDTSPALGA